MIVSILARPHIHPHSDDFYLKTDKTRQIALSTIPVGRIGTQEDSE